jgi:hypothetical protein
LGKFCFFESKIELLTFEAESHLRRIDGFCFSGCPLTSISIPKSTDFIDGFAFHGSSITSISVQNANPRFRICAEFLLDSLDSITVRYFGGGGNVFVAKAIRVIGKTCFCRSRNESLQIALVFEAGSVLQKIDDSAFANCSSRSVCIPGSVEVLGKSCFEGAKIEELCWGPGSQLREIGESCFADCSLKLICILDQSECLASVASGMQRFGRWHLKAHRN